MKRTASCFGLTSMPWIIPNGLSTRTRGGPGPHQSFGTAGCLRWELLFCLEANKGVVVWEKSLAKEYGVKEFTGITASPLIEDKLLILQICAKPTACVVAFDKNSGKEAWRALDDSFTYSSPIILTAGGRKQLIVWTQEAVTSLDPATGKTWWREMLRTSGDAAVSTPVFS